MILKLKDGDVKIELFIDHAPEHVKRIKKLADDGLYDGVVFHSWVGYRHRERFQVHRRRSQVRFAKFTSRLWSRKGKMDYGRDHRRDAIVRRVLLERHRRRVLLECIVLLNRAANLRAV